MQAGFNTQFSWSFAQLATLHYQWPFDSSDPALAQTSSGGGGLAEALGSLITTDSLKASIAIPNLPSSLPPDYSPSYTGERRGRATAACWWQRCPDELVGQHQRAGLPGRLSKRGPEGCVLCPPTPPLSTHTCGPLQARSWAVWRPPQIQTWSRPQANARSSSARRGTPRPQPALCLRREARRPCCLCGREGGVAT